MAHFISADTLIPQPGDSGNWDRYAYVLNNPLKYIDPSGKTPSPYIGPYCDPDDPNCTSYGQVDEVETVHVHQKKNTDCGHSAIVMAARLGTGDNSIPYESVQKDIGGVWADGPTLPNTMLKRVNDYLEKSPLRYDNGIYEGQYTYATREQGSIEQMAEEINKGNIVLVILIWEKIKYYGHWVVPISVTSDTSNNPLVSYLDPGFGKDKNRSFNYPESNFSSDPNDSFIEGFNRKKWWAPGITNTYIVIHHEVTSVNLDLLHTLFTANSPNIPRPE